MIRINSRERYKFHASGPWARKIVRECHYCGVGITRETATIDHVVPVSKGGGNQPDNFVLACSDCNSMRGAGDYRRFKSHMLPVKRARRAGEAIPDVGPFIDEKKPKKKPKDGYTQSLLLACITVDGMRKSGHSWAEIASHWRVSTAAARAMCVVGCTPAGQRREVAERLGLLKLVGDAL